MAKPDQAAQFAQAIVTAIIADLTGRSGGDWYWDGIDRPTQREIRRTWAAIIRKQARAMQIAFPPAPPKED